MSEAVKQEFFRWMHSLDTGALNDSQKKLLNIFVLYFDVVEPLGTAGGKRAKKVNQLIQKHHGNLPTSFPDLSMNQQVASERVDRIVELVIGPFRGFTNKEKFILNKKYAFIYGPNGSGKSSFCEGLEYALLGDIEEATAKRIKLSDYIRNTEKDTSSTPVAYTMANGQKKSIDQNQALYRFSFVEKNRINGFARITAATNSMQKDRIATLFGLNAFSEFVDGFTDNFRQYLLLEPTKGKAFEDEQNSYNANTKRKEQINKDFDQVRVKIQTLIQELAIPEITSLEEIESFLIGTDGVSGKINQLQQAKAEQIPDDIEHDSIDQIFIKVSEAQALLAKLEKDLIALQDNSSKVNFKDLYSALTAIADSSDNDHSLCPACKTPLIKVEVDPFDNARNELTKLEDLAELQARIPDNARSLARLVNNTRALLQTVKNNASKAGYKEQGFPPLTDVDYTDIEQIPSWHHRLKRELESFSRQQGVGNSIRTVIQKCNADLATKRSKQDDIDKEIRKYQKYNTRCIELKASQGQLVKEKEQVEKAILDFKKNNSQKVAEVEAEKKSLKINQDFLDAYEKLISNLKQYRNRLPQKLSAGLSEKVKEYYNNINSHDPEFEHLSFFSLPEVAGDKIRLKFTGENVLKDALHVLSEGHIKVLGLSILLAKSVHENIGFIIFDDIVNAIDDDHRSGIAELLITHPDFKNKQQIITCHGEQFINKLEHRLGASAASKEVNRYRFYPVDSISERGVKLSIGDAKHYLVQAQDAFNSNSLKDAASKCRQAVESLAETLWKKLGREKSINLTVKMRAPGAQPDLFTVVLALIKELKGIDKTSVAYKTFSELKDKYPWSILNKGTHEQDSLPEFERTDISYVMQLLETLEKEISETKFSTVASSGSRQ